MGESVDAQVINQDKMGSVGVPALEVSISFGRFENDSLSWERWSSFSQNKYLEEVEKCATPGSVAMKKAYFEAHYKKIAAKKAELMDHQAQIESDLSRSDEPCGEADLEPQSFDGQCSIEEIMERTSLFGEGSNTSVDEPEDEVEEANQMDCTLDSLSLRTLEEEEAVSVKEESPSIVTEQTADISQNVGDEIKSTPKDKNEIVKQDILKKAKQTTTTNKERIVTRVTKKKLVSPLPALRKKPQVSTPSMSRPTSTTSALMSASRSSTKKATNSPLSTSKPSSIGERRKVVPSSIHMSIILDARKSYSAPPVTARKSLMMEQMGDKDIVKRAFKTFQIQSNVSQSKPYKDNISPLPKQVLRKGTGLKESSLTTPKYKEGSHRAGGVQGRSAMTVSSPLISRSSDQTDTRKKILKKPDDKSNPKQADKNHLRSKSKEQKEADIKKLRQSLNFKATPLPVFYRGKQMSKSLLDKNNSENDTHH